MNIYVGGKKISLHQNHFVAKGGEALLYHKDNIAYKIYDPVTNMIPRGKITELSLLDDPSIVSPKEIIMNSNKENIGFTMDWLGTDMVALCKLFTTKYRDDNSIENDTIVQLVENIKNKTKYIHNNKCLIVDGNELNYLVSKDFLTPYFIDVNSWQTPNYKATAIMSSIRDWTAGTNFTQLTDWFSFAIISFQLFIGIHPFKGRHKKYKRNDFENRIRDNVSVFNSEVRLPPVVRDFNLIPSSYKDWYYKLFERGERIEPPMLPGSFEKVQVTIQVIKNTNLFEIKRIFEVDENILYHNPVYGFTKTKNKIYLGKTDYKVSKNVEVLYTPLEQIPIFVKLKDGIAEFKIMQSGYKLKTVAFVADDMMIVDNVLYLKSKDNLLEITMKVFNQNIMPVVKTAWKIEYSSSKLFSNVIYQNLLGKAHLCIPQPVISKSRSNMFVKAVPELDDYKIIEAKYENQICMLIGHANNQYDKIILTFDKKFRTYACRILNDIDYVPLNFTVLDSGVCVSIEDEAIEIFFNDQARNQIKRIEDPDIDNSMRLFKDGTILKFHKDNTVYSMKMK